MPKCNIGVESKFFRMAAEQRYMYAQRVLRRVMEWLHKREISSNNKMTLDISSKLVIGDRMYSNIMSIAVLCDCGEGDLADIIKKNHCHIATSDDAAHTYIIFNKPAKTIAKFAGLAGVPSFIYCHAGIKEAWRMKHPNLKYNSVKNPYIFDGNAEATFSDALLHSADKAIGKALDAVREQFHLNCETNDCILDYIYNMTGMKAAAYKKCFIEALIK